MSDSPRSHLVALGDGWHVWRSCALRSAGFPAEDALAFGSPRAVALADEIAQQEADLSDRVKAALEAVAANAGDPAAAKTARRALDHHLGTESASVLALLPDAIVQTRDQLDARWAELERVWHDELPEVCERLHRAAASPRFREALLLHNPGAVRTAIDPMLAHATEPPSSVSRGKKARQRERLAISYLQRYCLKNDTIGFFGPCGWAAFTERQGLLAEPGPALEQRRELHLETWCLDEVAKKFDDPAARPWLAPRLLAIYGLLGNRLFVPFNDPTDLPHAMAWLLAHCDGTRTAKQLSAEATRTPSLGLTSESAVFGILEDAHARGLIAWNFEIPIGFDPERTLRQQVEAIEDDAIRAPRLAVLDELESVRRQISASAGDPAAIAEGIARLESMFTDFTGVPSTRRGGKVYAGRTLFYADSVRDVHVELGTDVLARLAPPLALILACGRWFTADFANRQRAALTRKFHEVASSLGTAAIDLFAFQTAVLTDDALAKNPNVPMRETQAEFDRRWKQLVAIPSGQRRVELRAEDLAAGVRRLFAARGPGWTEARYLSPDVMLCAPSAEAASAGQARFVLGELHIGNTLMSALFFHQHPRPAELVRALDEELGEYVVPIAPKAWTTERQAIALVGPRAYRYEFMNDPGVGSPSQRLRMGDLVVTLTGNALEVRSRDGRKRFDLFDFMGTYWTAMTPLWFRSRDAHSPRITIDTLVVKRETWRFEPRELAFAEIADGPAQLIEVRRWARRHELPRYVFVRVSVEPKPLFVDLESALYVSLLAKVVREVLAAAGDDDMVELSEMLPNIEDLWLMDREGRRYTSEFRIIAVDPVRFAG